MELDELILVLTNCFNRQEVERLLGQTTTEDPFRMAAKLILEGDPIGEQLCERLDEDAHTQREQIRSMTLQGLRSSLTPAAISLMGQGPHFGYLLWSLLRDGRVGAAHIAHEISQSRSGKTPLDTGIAAQSFSESKAPAPSATTSAQTTRPTASFDDFDLEELEKSFDKEPDMPTEAESEEELDFGSIGDLDLDLGPVDDMELESESLSEPDSDFFDRDSLSQHGERDEMESLEDIDIPDLSAELSDLDDMFSESTVTDEDGDVTGAVHRHPTTAFDDTDLDLNLDFGTDDSTIREGAGIEEEDLEISLNEMDNLIDDTQSLLPGLDDEPERDTMDFETSFMGREDELIESDEGYEDDDFTLSLEETLDSGEPSPYVGPVDRLPSQYVGEVELAGISLSLSSLHKACESVFGERVELITDKDLVAEDKIAVVGRRCGIKILHGPSLAIEAPEGPSAPSSERIRISPISLQTAISKVFDEEIQLVPDPNLLSDGVIAFAGRHCGIVILRNAAAEVPLPPWVDPEMAAKIQAAAQAMLGQADWAQVDVPRLLQEHEQLQKTCKSLQSEFASLKAQLAEGSFSAASAPLAPAPTPTPIPQPEQERFTAPEPIPAPIPEIEEPQEEYEEIPELEEEEEVDLSGISDEEEIEIPDIDFETEETEEVSEVAEEPLEEAAELDIDLSEFGALEGEDEELEIPDLGDLGLDESDISTEDAGGDSLELDAEMDFGSEDSDGLMADIESMLAEDGGDEGVGKVLNGELVLILGGENSHEREYQDVVQQIGGTCEWHAGLMDMSEGEITELVERADIILTLADAITDPGILQATDLAQQLNKRCFAHHSSAPNSVKNQLIKLVEEGKV